jgi:hypothetical protein
LVVAGFVTADDFRDFCSIQFGEFGFDVFVAGFGIFELNDAFHFGLIVVAVIFLSTRSRIECRLLGFVIRHADVMKV